MNTTTYQHTVHSWSKTSELVKALNNKHHMSNSAAASTEKQTHTAVTDSCMKEGQRVASPISVVRPTVMSMHNGVYARRCFSTTTLTATPSILFGYRV